MRIAIDYDDTYTADEILFSNFIRTAVERGHDVRFVTARIDWHEQGWNTGIRQSAAMLNISVIYCDHAPKSEVCKEIGWIPDIWVDDSPDAIVSLSVSDGGVIVPEVSE